MRAGQSLRGVSDMRDKTRLISSAIWVAIAGCSAGGGDTDLWTTTHDLGGANYHFSPPQSPSGTGGYNYLGPQAIPSSASASGGSAGVATGGSSETGGLPSGGGLGGTGGTESGGSGNSSGQSNTGGVETGGVSNTGGVTTATGGITSSGGSGTGGTTTVSGKCSFTFDVTTVTAGSGFAPYNVGAIWISTGAGSFVRTLDEWGSALRIVNATAWETASKGNTVDAVTGATRRTDGPLSVHWDCTDMSNNPLPAGPYTISVTFAENDAGFFAPPPHIATVNFSIGAGPVMLTPPDQANFTQMSLTIQ